MRRLIALILLSTILLGTTPMVTASDASPTANNDVIVSETMNGTVSENIRVSDPEGSGEDVKVTNWPARQDMYGTVLRSLNNKYQIAPFKPKFSSVSFLKDRVIDRMAIPAVYTGSYDETKETVTETNTQSKINLENKSLGETRETNILGTDILTLKDTWNETQNMPYVELYGDTDDVTKGLAITACSKALGSQKYTIFAKYSAYTGVTENGNLPITKTPFVTMVSSNDINVKTDKYYTDIYISRTSPVDYWNTAKNNGMVDTEYVDMTLDAATKSIKAGTSPGECWDNLKLGDLAVYIKNFLYLNGEAVLTNEEESYLLAAYGKSLPYGIPSYQVEAVKYLMARGIIGNDEDFNTDITGNRLMTYLMRAKDKDSRLTFKVATLDYDKSLVDSGFFPIEVENSAVTVNNPVWNYNVAGSDYLDYFVKVDSKTIFKDTKRRTLDSLRVASASDMSTTTKYTDSNYLGVEDGYYHFQVPTSISTTTDACKNNYITVCAGVDTLNPYNIKLKYGGGWYDNFIEEKRTDSKRSYQSDRRPFSYNDSKNLIDLESKDTSIAMIQNKLFLAKDKSVTYTFETDTISSFRWDGEVIPDDGTEIKGCSYNKDTKVVTIKFESSKSNPEKSIKQRLTVDSKADSVTFPAYMSTGDIILVSKSFLDKNLHECSVTELPDSTGVWRVSFSNMSILIDVNNKKVTSGQCIEEFSSDDKSPLLIKYTDGEVLIDYRCLKGIINQNLVLNEKGTGVKAISTEKVRGTLSGNDPYLDENVKPLLGDSNVTDSQIYVNSVGTMLLESVYTKSNFLLYKKTTGSTKSASLLVFKPKIDGVETQDVVKTKLKEDYNIELGESENCTIYYLTDNVTVVEGTAGGAYTELEVGKEGDEIQYSTIDGYTYSIPKMTTWDFKTYYDVNKRCITSIIPIVKQNGMYIDINANIFLSSGPYKFPGSAMNTAVSQKLGTEKGIAFNESTNGGYAQEEVNITDSNNSIQYAPAGLFLKYYKEESKVVKDIVGTQVLYGTMGGFVQDNSLINNTTGYYFKSNTLQLPVNANDKYYVLNYTNYTASTIYLYDNAKSSKVGNFSKSETAPNAISDFLKELSSKNIFDWANFNLLRLFQNIDNILTLIFIFLLSIVPRIMIMDFLILATLSFVAKYPLVIFICNKVVDFYKLLSCFQIDVNTIEVERIWMSTFWATVILGMLQQESLIHLLTWVDEWVFVLLSR